MRFSNSFIFVAAMLGSLILFFLLFYRPSNNIITQLRDQITDGRNRMNEEDLIIKKVKQEKMEVSVLIDEVDQLKSTLLRPNEVSPLMKALRSLCHELGFQNGSIFLKGREFRDDFEVHVVEISLRGGFEEIYRFIIRLEDLPVTVQIDMLEMQGEPQKGDWIKARMKLSAPIAGT